MKHGFVTVSIPFDAANASAVDKALKDDLGNVPKQPVRDALDATECIHFMSMTVICDPSDLVAHLVLEASADLEPAPAIAAITAGIGDHLVNVLQAAGKQVEKENLAGFLKHHSLDVGPGWMQTSGLLFSGTPGLTVRRIREEAQLATWIQKWLDADRTQEKALEKLERIRNAVFERVDLKWKFPADPWNDEQLRLRDGIGRLLWSLLLNFFWPLLIPPLLFVFLAATGALVGTVSGVVTGVILGVIVGGVIGIGLAQFASSLFGRPIAVIVGALMGVGMGAVLGWIGVVTHALSGLLVSALLGAVAGIAIAKLVNLFFNGAVMLVTGAAVGAAFGGLAGAAFGFGMLLGLGTLLSALFVLFPILGLEITVVVLVLAFGAWLLRQSEKSDQPQDLNPSEERIARLMALENQTRQNHLTAVSVMKAGWYRRLALRYVFWVLGELGPYFSKRGTLAGIATIHFARWVLLPETDRLLFYSNYDGSWVSYLEDFIERAARGLTAVWSNTWHFPKTEFLLQMGARDGERFKRWARTQQQPTWFWYSAYPELTTERVRVHARIRHLFASADTEEQAASFLECFRFEPREQEIEKAKIPTLVFGGLKGLHFSQALLVRFRDDSPAHVKEWLRFVDGQGIHYGEAMPVHAVALGLAATGLKKLGLDAGTLASFPTAFQNGMPKRAHVLGDVDVDDPKNWHWGNGDREADAIVVLYYPDKKALEAATKLHLQTLQDLGHQAVYRLDCKEIPPKGEPLREAFGFVDGTSQPIVRGTRKWEQQRNAIHIIEPGEMVLGYRDNLNYIAPIPSMNGADLGRNGTFLVVRQMEQDVGGFQSFLTNAAIAFAGDTRVPKYQKLEDLEEWIAAKMVGRWRKDGTSLVRYPDKPAADTTDPSSPDNDFLFGNEDPHGVRCPFGAHIRRANPRDSFDPGSKEQLDVSNRHRIFRVGRSYEAQSQPGQKALSQPGLLFMCVNADIEGQFEFLHHTWVLGSTFHNLEDEIDPVVGYRSRIMSDRMTIPTENGPVCLKGMRDFVTIRGGGYFFMPGKDALARLAS